MSNAWLAVVGVGVVTAAWVTTAVECRALLGKPPLPELTFPAPPPPEEEEPPPKKSRRGRRWRRRVPVERVPVELWPQPPAQGAAAERRALLRLLHEERRARLESYLEAYQLSEGVCLCPRHEQLRRRHLRQALRPANPLIIEKLQAIEDLLDVEVERVGGVANVAGGSGADGNDAPQCRRPRKVRRRRARVLLKGRPRSKAAAKKRKRRAKRSKRNDSGWETDG